MSVWDQGRQPSGFQPQLTEFDAILRGSNVTPRSTPEQLKRDILEAQAADETRANNITVSGDFLSLHSEFLDTPTNAEKFNRTLDAMFGANRAYSLDEFESAYTVCRANSILELDQVEIVKQQQAAANAQRKALTKRQPV